MPPGLQRSNRVRHGCGDPDAQVLKYRSPVPKLAAAINGRWPGQARFDKARNRRRPADKRVADTITRSRSASDRRLRRTDISAGVSWAGNSDDRIRLDSWPTLMPSGTGRDQQGGRGSTAHRCRGPSSRKPEQAQTEPCGSQTTVLRIEQQH